MERFPRTILFIIYVSLKGGKFWHFTTTYADTIYVVVRLVISYVFRPMRCFSFYKWTIVSLIIISNNSQIKRVQSLSNWKKSCLFPITVPTLIGGYLLFLFCFQNNDVKPKPFCDSLVIYNGIHEQLLL